MKLFLLFLIQLTAFHSRADGLDQVTISLNGRTVWSTTSQSSGKEFNLDTLLIGDTLRFHAWTDWNGLHQARLVIDDMNSKKVLEIGRDWSHHNGAVFQLILKKEHFQHELRIWLDYNVKNFDDWWFCTLTTSVLIQKNKLQQDLYDADKIWDSVGVKASWFQENATKSTNLEDIPSDFTEFYEQFISDSIFQQKHIAFNELIGVIGECDTTVRMNQQNWKFTNWNFTKHFDYENHNANLDGWLNCIFYSENKFFYEFRLKEVGVIYQTGFEKINGTWMLTFKHDFNC